MTGRNIALWFTALLLTLAIGCSGSTPGAITPDLTKKTSQSINPCQLWGYWHCYMNNQTKQIEVVQLRTASFTANVNNILEAKPGNLLITDLDLSTYLTDGKLGCNVTLKHPFPGLDQYDGFDVWGVFLHNGASSLKYDNLTYSGGPAAGQDKARLLNADGYTRWYNQPEFNGSSIPLFEYTPGKLANLSTPTATLNPYKIFADNLGPADDYYSWIATPGNADNRGIFKAGSSNSRRYLLQFPMIGGAPKLDFQYAVIANWEPGNPSLTGDPAHYDPGDFPTSANVEEAFFINSSTAQSDLFNDGTGNFGGSFRSTLEVFDWQGGSVGHNVVTNEINRVLFEGSFLPGGSQEFSQTQLASLASPGTSNSSVYQIDIPGCSPTSSGQAEYWVIVEAAGLNGASYGQGFPTKFPDQRRAAFLRSSVTVSSNSQTVPVTYHLKLSIERSTTNQATGIILDWDDNAGITGYNIYRKNPYDATDTYKLLPASPVIPSTYTDHDIVGNEAYQYQVIGLVGATEMPDKSVEAYAILSDAEDNVSTHAVWATCAFPLMYNPNYLPQSLFNEFAPYEDTPENGSYCWDESGLQNGPGPLGDYWTGSATIVASPILLLPAGSTTCEMDFGIRLNNVPSSYSGDKCGVAVGVTNVVDDGPNNPFVPSNHYVAGLNYNLTHIQGLSEWGNYTNITTANDAGFGVQYPSDGNIQYTYSKFSLPDIFTTPNARAAFGWGCGNAAGGAGAENPGTSLDDIGVVVY